MKDLTDNARTNDEIFDITRSLILDLLECNTIEKVSSITSVQKQFVRLRNVDACELILLNHSMLSLSTAIRVEDSKVIKDKFSDVFRLGNPSARNCKKNKFYIFSLCQKRI